MSTLQERIEKFRTMAEANPQDELANFSLGRALLEADDAAGAVPAFQKVLAISPKHSKSYQMLAQAQLKLGHKDHAVDTLKQGVRVADERGDLMPRNDMAQMLKDLGVETPVATTRPAADAPVGDGQVQCKRCGQVTGKMPRPPFSAQQGVMIWNNICPNCWREWIGMGTKVINELRLPLNDPQAQKVYDQHMLDFLNLKA